MVRRVEVLGPTLVDGERLPPLRTRVLTALVALRSGGATVSALEQLAWEDRPPATARASLQNQVAGLRRRMGQDAITWDGERYRLDPTIRTDLEAVFADVAAVEAARSRGDAEEVLEVASTALARFRGQPFEDLPNDVDTTRQAVQQAQAVRARLAEMHADALSATGRTTEAEVAWRQLVDEQPYHEGRWAGLVAALDAAGRRADALEAYREARETLRDNLGLAPGTALESAHEAVLRGTAARAPDGGDAVLPRPDVRKQVLDAVAEHRVVALMGPAGAGKSTLLGQLRDPRLGARTVRIDCGSSPWTALEPLHELLEAVGADPVASRTTPTGDLPGQVGAALATAADERPVLVTIDDAPAGGPTTWRALAAAVAASPHLHLVLAVRTGEDAPAVLGEVATVDLPPLDLGEVQQLAELVLRRRGRTDELAAWLADHTGGNPLFVRELVLDLRYRGRLRRGGDGVLRPPDHLPVPERLQAIVGQRLGSLGLRARRSCDVLATVAPIEDEAVLEVLGVTAADVDLLRDAQLLAPGPEVAFRHAALQEVARELTPPGRRIEIALVAAEALADRGARPAAVAHLRLAAAEVAPTAAAAACLRAARAAQAEQAFGEAVTWSDRGLEVLQELSGEHDGVGIELAVVGADAARLGGADGHATRLLTAAERALASSEPDLRRQAALALLRLGECCQPGEEQARAVALGRRALELEDDADHAARLHASLSLTTSMVDPVATREHIEAALAQLEAHDHDRLAIEVLPYTYMALGLPDDLDRRREAAQRLAEAAANLGDPVAEYEADHLAFSVALAAGTREELLAAHRRMEAARTIVADAGRRWSLHYQRATLAQLDLEVEEAMALATAAREVGVTVAQGRAWATWTAQALELHRLAGTLDELAPVVVPMVDAPGALPAWRAAAALVLAPADPDRARDALVEAVPALLDGPQDFSTLAALQTAGRACAQVEAAGQAARLLPRLRPWADRWSWQGTTTYGPVGDVVAALAALVGATDAVEEGRAGAAAARTRLAADDYP